MMATQVAQDAGDGDALLVVFHPEPEREPVLGEDGFDLLVDVLPKGIGALTLAFAVVDLAVLGNDRQGELQVGKGHVERGSGFVPVDLILVRQKAIKLGNIDVRRKRETLNEGRLLVC